MIFGYFGLFSAVLMACSYLFMLFETCCSNTQDYLDHKYTLQEADAKVLENRKVQIYKWIFKIQTKLWENVFIDFVFPKKMFAFEFAFP